MVKIQSKVTHRIILGPLGEFQFGCSIIFYHLWHFNLLCLPSL